MLACDDPDIGDLADQRRGAFAAVGLINEAVERGAPAAVDAERREFTPLAQQRYVGGAVRQRFDFIDRAEAAAVETGTAGIRAQRPLREHHRIQRLQDFRRRNGGGRDRVIAVIQSIGLRIAAQAAAEKAEHHPAPAVLAPAGKRQRVDGGKRRAVGALRGDFGKRAEHRVDDAQDRLGVAADRPRRGDSEQRGVRDHEFDRRQAAGIGRHVGEDVLERDIAAGDRGGERNIEWAVAGRRRAREVEPHRVAGNDQIERDAQRHIGDAVIVEKIVVRVSTVGQVGDIGAHQLFSTRGQEIERRGDQFLPIVLEQGLDPPFAQIERIELAVEIAPVRLRYPRIGCQNVDDVLLDHAGSGQLHRRNAEPLLEAFGRLGVEISWHVAADVEPVADRSQPCEQFAVPEQRPHQAKIVEVGAAVIGVVVPLC